MKNKKIYDFLNNKDKYLFLNKLKTFQNIKKFTLLFILLYFFSVFDLKPLDMTFRFSNQNFIYVLSRNLGFL